MKNNRNIPSELNDFNKLMDTIARRHGYYKVFTDFLDMTINAFSFNYEIDSENLQKTYSVEERQQFGKMIYELISILDKTIKTDTCWYDALGTIYEAQSLTNKKYFAQFFTPTTVCNFMAQILGLENEFSLHEPAAGSGRFCLAAHVINPKMFHYAVDLDYTCARMTAINMMFHGIDGIIIADNGLFPKNNFRGAFIINRKLKHTGIPQIEYVKTANEAYRYIDYRFKLRTGKIYTENSILSSIDIPKIQELNFEHKTFSSSDQLKLF